MIEIVPTIHGRNLFFYLFKIDIISHLTASGFFGGRLVRHRVRSIIGMLPHLILHIPKTFFYLLCGFINGNDKMKNKPVKQVDQKSVK